MSASAEALVSDLRKQLDDADTAWVVEYRIDDDDRHIDMHQLQAELQAFARRPDVSPKVEDLRAEEHTISPQSPFPSISPAGLMDSVEVKAVRPRAVPPPENIVADSPIDNGVIEATQPTALVPIVAHRPLPSLSKTIADKGQQPTVTATAAPQVSNADFVTRLLQLRRDELRRTTVTVASAPSVSSLGVASETTKHTPTTNAAADVAARPMVVDEDEVPPATQRTVAVTRATCAAADSSVSVFAAPPASNGFSLSPVKLDVDEPSCPPTPPASAQHPRLVFHERRAVRRTPVLPIELRIQKDAAARALVELTLTLVTSPQRATDAPLSISPGHFEEPRDESPPQQGMPFFVNRKSLSPVYIFADDADHLPHATSSIMPSDAGSPHCDVRYVTASSGSRDTRFSSGIVSAYPTADTSTVAHHDALQLYTGAPASVLDNPVLTGPPIADDGWRPPRRTVRSALGPDTRRRVVPAPKTFSDEVPMASFAAAELIAQQPKHVTTPAAPPQDTRRVSSVAPAAAFEPPAGDARDSRRLSAAALAKKEQPRGPPATVTVYTYPSTHESPAMSSRPVLRNYQPYAPPPEPPRVAQDSDFGPAFDLDFGPVVAESVSPRSQHYELQSPSEDMLSPQSKALRKRSVTFL